MKNLFIPHKGNNYKPEVLHPKRLLFHATAAVVIKAVIVGFLFAYPISAWLAPDILAEQGRKLIALTNEIRKNLKLDTLRENDLLNKAALNKAQDMLLKQYFNHVSPEQKGLAHWLSQIKYDYAAAGENLAMGFSGADEVIEGWKKSKTHYANIIDPEFREIGAGVVGGNYYGIDTTFVAQFFGALVSSSVAGIVKATVADNAVVDPANTKLMIIDPVGQEEKVVSAVAYLNPEAARAEVSLGDYRFALNKEEGSNKWTGGAVIFKKQAAEFLNLVVPAVISITDKAGTTAAVDINWENVKPLRPSLLDQYFFFKNNPTNYLKPLLNISSIYYQLMLAVLIIAFLLNIFIEIRKQHPRIILLSLGTIMLFIFLIVI